MKIDNELRLQLTKFDRQGRIHGGKIELRQSDDGQLIVTGHAAVFNQKSDNLGGFREIIAPGAFSDVLNNDVRFLVNHDGMPLARTISGSLKLREDDVGLSIRAELDEEDPDVRALAPKLRRGDINQMSFAFATAEDDFAVVDGELIRTLVKIAELFDVSPVTFPAYPQTDISARALFESKIHELSEKQGLKPEEKFLKQQKDREEFLARRMAAPDPLDLREIIRRCRIKS